MYLKMGNQRQRMTEHPRKTDKRNSQHPVKDDVEKTEVLILHCLFQYTCTVSQQTALVRARFKTDIVLYPSAVQE